MKKSKFKFKDRAGFAWNGIRSATRSEPNFRFHLFGGAASFGLLGYFRAPPLWWAIFAILVASILAAELFNTSLENLADRVHPEIHPQIRVAKDCAAAAVLVLAIASLGVLVAFLFQFIF